MITTSQSILSAHIVNGIIRQDLMHSLETYVLVQHSRKGLINKFNYTYKKYTACGDV